MTGIIPKLFGKSKKSSKMPIKKSTSKPSLISTSKSSSATTMKSTQLNQTNSDLVTPPPPLPQPNVHKQDNVILFSKDKIEEDDVGDYLRIQDKNDIQIYLKHFHQYQLEEDHYYTISSTSSSKPSLHDALFSSSNNISDNFSEITHYSDLPTTLPFKLPIQTATYHKDEVYYEKYFYEMYTNAFANKSLEVFKQMSKEGTSVFNQLNEHTKRLISFAQYRAGLHAEQRNDLTEACQYYYQAAKIGLVIAKVSFGNLLLFNQVQSNLQKEAVDMLIDASNKGFAIASLALALYYEKSNQISLAATFGEKYKMSNNKSELYYVGCYQIGVILLKAGFLEKAFQSFKLSAKSPFKYTPAFRKLGVLSLLGIGTQQSAAIAFSLIQEAAKLGDEPANIILGQFYQQGIGCSRDLSSAMKIYQNYSDNIAAQFSMGLILLDKNPQKAYEHFLNVVRFKLTTFDTSHWNVQSIQYESAVKIALWEFNGIGGAKKDPEGAFYTLKKLSETCGYSGAHYWLGCAYLEGVKRNDGSIVVAPDQKELAFQCFLRGDQQNKPNCQFYVGKMLKEGFQSNGYSKKDAFQFFLKAAKSNYYPAFTPVGVYYYRGGLGTEGRDLNRAFFYFLAAAKYGNDPLAIQYLADYLIRNEHVDHVDTNHICKQLNHAAGVENDPIAYRMLALVTHHGIEPFETYEKDNALFEIYKIAKSEQGDIKFRFALHCIWKAIELNDHASGQCLNQFYPNMSFDDQMKTIQLFEKLESGVPNKMTFAYAQFLKISKNRSTALKKFIEIAKYNDMTTNIGWNSRLEAAKLILFENEGKATSKIFLFTWLNQMVQHNQHGKTLAMPFIFLAKCHDMELCSGCNKELAAELYEKGLEHKPNDISIEMFARMRLIEIYYNQYMDEKLKEQVDLMEPLLNSLSDDSLEKKSRSADFYYYRGLISLHNGTIFNYREKARYDLVKSDRLGNIFASLELGYLYGTMKSNEDTADEYFQKVENSPKTKISFSKRLVESMVQVRTQHIHSDYDYLEAIIKMKFSAGMTYSYYQMERQAMDWFKEISDYPLASVMILYYKMKDVKERTQSRVQLLSDILNSLEIQSNIDYDGRMALSYGQLRLGQCYEYGHGVSIDQNKVSEYYNKAAAFLQNNEIYERLAEMADNTTTDLMFPTLYNAARNDKDAMFKLAQYYYNKKEIEKAANQYLKAAEAGHLESGYYYAKYYIEKHTSSSIAIGAAFKCKKAAQFLQITAQRNNHGPSYYELGKLEMDVGLYEEGVEDLMEAAFLKVGAASYRLGELYEAGFTGIIGDKVTFRLASKPQKAFEFYKDALENGYMPALIKLGFFFEHGLIDGTNIEKAKEYYMEALNSNQCSGGISEYALGCLEETLLSHFPTKKFHKADAFEWFQKSFKAGNQKAKFKIGCYLLHGYSNKEQDIQNGLYILEEEKKNGNVEAMKELAKYYTRIGKDKNAFQCWKNAAMFEDPEAYEFIAECYEKGLLGQSVNYEEARIFRADAIEARKRALETQHSMMGFKSDYSEERNKYLK